MTASGYEIRLCQNCGLRYPLVEGHPFGESCPLCRSETRVILRRKLVTEPIPIPPVDMDKRIQVEAMLDNIRSAWNVGSMFRSADGFGIQHMHLCGITPTPEYEGVGKTALGADQGIPWTHYHNALDAAQKLKENGAQLWALEQDQKAIPITDITFPVVTSFESTQGNKILLIVGNEITGVDPGLLDLCDEIFYIPMLGQKRSLNVAVAFGVAAYWLASSQILASG